MRHRPSIRLYIRCTLTSYTNYRARIKYNLASLRQSTGSSSCDLILRLVVGGAYKRTGVAMLILGSWSCVHTHAAHLWLRPQRLSRAQHGPGRRNPTHPRSWAMLSNSAVALPANPSFGNCTFDGYGPRGLYETAAHWLPRTSVFQGPSTITRSYLVFCACRLFTRQRPTRL